MGSEAWIAVIGTVAAVCTTVAFVPQMVRIRRQGGRDLSYGMLFLYLAGVLLWLAYGLLTGARSVSLANAAAALLVSATLVLKRMAGKSSRARLRIAIDMDEVLTDSVGKLLRVYNETFGDTLTVHDLRGRSLEEIVPASRAEAAREIESDPSFFADLEPLEGSQEVVRELAERYEVLVATAAMEIPTSFGAKFAWLRRHLPFIPPSQLVFCGDKGVLDADYLIDDTPRHFHRFRGTPVLFSAPHNLSEERFLRVQGWAEVRRMFQR